MPPKLTNPGKFTECCPSSSHASVNCWQCWRNQRKRSPWKPCWGNNVFPPSSEIKTAMKYIYIFNYPCNFVPFSRKIRPDSNIREISPKAVLCNRESRWTLNRWVLSLLWKLVSDLAVLTWAGSSFHHCGAGTVKSWDLEERCLAVFSEGGTSRLAEAVEWSARA